SGPGWHDIETGSGLVRHARLHQRALTHLASDREVSGYRLGALLHAQEPEAPALLGAGDGLVDRDALPVVLDGQRHGVVVVVQDDFGQRSLRVLRDVVQRLLRDAHDRALDLWRHRPRGPERPRRAAPAPRAT